MTLTTTPGSSLADSYASVAELRAYAVANYAPTTATTDEEVEQALRRSTRYVDGRYRSRFLGFRTNGFVQALEWPRAGVVLSWEANDPSAFVRYYAGGFEPGTYIANDIIPQMLTDAVCEAAIRELASPGSLTPDQTPSRRKIQQTVGPITTIWANDPMTRPVVTVIDELLAPLLVRRSAYSGAVVRA